MVLLAYTHFCNYISHTQFNRKMARVFRVNMYPKLTRVSAFQLSICQPLLGACHQLSSIWLPKAAPCQSAAVSHFISTCQLSTTHVNCISVFHVQKAVAGSQPPASKGSRQLLSAREPHQQEATSLSQPTNSCFPYSHLQCSCYQPAIEGC